METRAWKERIRGVPRKGALLTASAVLLMAGPVVEWLLSKVVEDYYTSVSIFFCLLTVAGGILLLTAWERKAGCAVGGALVLFGAAVTMNRPLLLAAALCCQKKVFHYTKLFSEILNYRIPFYSGI